MAIGSAGNDRDDDSHCDSRRIALDDGLKPSENTINYNRHHKLNHNSASPYIYSDVLDGEANAFGEDEEMLRIYGARTLRPMKDYLEKNSQEFAIPDGIPTLVKSLTQRKRDQLFVSTLAKVLEDKLVGKDSKDWVKIVEGREYLGYLKRFMPHVLNFRVGSDNVVHFGNFFIGAPRATGDHMQLMADIVAQCTSQHDIESKIINLIKKSSQDLHQHLKTVVGIRLAISWLNYHMSFEQGTMVHQMQQRTVVNSFEATGEASKCLSPIYAEVSQSQQGDSELRGGMALSNVRVGSKPTDDGVLSEGASGSGDSNGTTVHSLRSNNISGSLHWLTLVDNMSNKMEAQGFVLAAERATNAWQEMVHTGTEPSERTAAIAKFSSALREYVAIHEEIVIEAKALVRNWNRKVPAQLSDQADWLQQHPVRAILSMALRCDKQTRIFCAHYHNEVDVHGEDFRWSEETHYPNLCTGTRGAPCQHFPFIVYPGDEACYGCQLAELNETGETTKTQKSFAGDFLEAMEPKRNNMPKRINASSGRSQAGTASKSTKAAAQVLNRRQLRTHLLLEDLYEERTLDEKVIWAKAKITHGNKTCCGKLKRGHKTECLTKLLKNQVTSHGKLTKKLSKNKALVNRDPHLGHLLESCKLPINSLKNGRKVSKECLAVIDSLFLTSFLIKEMRDQGLITTGRSLYDQYGETVDQSYIGILSTFSDNMSRVLKSVSSLNRHFVNVLSRGGEDSSEDKDSDETEDERADGKSDLRLSSEDSEEDEDGNGGNDKGYSGGGDDGGDDSPSDSSDYDSDEASSEKSSSEDDESDDGDDNQRSIGLVGRVKARKRGTSSAAEKPLMNLEISTRKVDEDYSLHLTVSERDEFVECLERGQGTVDKQNKIVTDCIDLLGLEDEILCHGAELAKTSTTQASLMKNVAKNLLGNPEAIEGLMIPRRSSDRIAYNRDKLKPLYKHFTRQYLAYLLFDNAMIEEFKSKYGKRKKHATADEENLRKISKNIQQVCTLVRRTFSEVVDKITEGCASDHEHEFTQMSKEKDAVALKLRFALLNLGKGNNMSVNQRKEQAMSQYRSLRADDLTASIPNLIHKWIETIQLAIAAGNTGLKEVDHEATLFAKQLKLNVDKAYVDVSSRRAKLIADGKKLTRKVKGSYGVEQPYPTQAEYLMLKDYKAILDGYLETVGTGVLKVSLYDMESDIVCPVVAHPWTYLFVKFSEFEKNANKSDWRIVYSEDANHKAERDAKKSAEDKGGGSSVRGRGSKGRGQGSSSSSSVGAVSVDDEVQSLIESWDQTGMPPDALGEYINGVQLTVHGCFGCAGDHKINDRRWIDGEWTYVCPAKDKNGQLKEGFPNEKGQQCRKEYAESKKAEWDKLGPSDKAYVARRHLEQEGNSKEIKQLREDIQLLTEQVAATIQQTKTTNKVPREELQEKYSEASERKARSEWHSREQRMLADAQEKSQRAQSVRYSEEDDSHGVHDEEYGAGY